MAVRREPVAMGLTPDGKHLLVANHLPHGRADQGQVVAVVSVIDARARLAQLAAFPDASEPSTLPRYERTTRTPSFLRKYAITLSAPLALSPYIFGQDTPNEETLFDVTTVMDRLGIDHRTRDLPPWHYGLLFTRIDC